VTLDLRILKELQAHFSDPHTLFLDLRILKDLAWASAVT
jgi:hypothetical protein